jgi:hypothetical protein
MNVKAESKPKDLSTEAQNEKESTEQEWARDSGLKTPAPNLGPGFMKTSDGKVLSQTLLMSPGSEVRRLVSWSPGIRNPQCLLCTLLCFCG